MAEPTGPARELRGERRPGECGVDHGGDGSGQQAESHEHREDRRVEQREEQRVQAEAIEERRIRYLRPR